MAAGGESFGIASVVPVFWLLLLILALAVPVLYRTSIRFPPAWRSLVAYVALMALAVLALRVA